LIVTNSDDCFIIDLLLTDTSLDAKDLENEYTEVYFERLDPGNNYKLKIISYIRTWELRKENGKRVFWKADDINGELLTDLNIAFAEIRNGSEIFISSTEWKDGFFDLFDQIAELKRKYPSLKVNLSIGGWGVDGFSDVAYYENSRNAFVNNVMEWVEEYGFDGVDIDWEYPVNGANGIIKARPSDKTNFTLLMSITEKNG